MSTKVLQQSRHALTPSGDERDSLLGLLRQTLGEARVEVRRTHTPAFRDSVHGHEAVIRTLIEKGDLLPGRQGVRPLQDRPLDRRAADGSVGPGRGGGHVHDRHRDRVPRCRSV